MANTAETSEIIGSIAGRILQDRHVAMRYRRVAGSALRQRPRWFEYLKRDPEFIARLYSRKTQ
jgi:hypothetical protein